ncbi:MAG: hypothetical protein PHX18_03315 [Candidatus Gastranaerophilales bacterium]|nr:hypothetical protein [Candidatus Gastranaerophilales bacterium]
MEIRCNNFNKIAKTPNFSAQNAPEKSKQPDKLPSDKTLDNTTWSAFMKHQIQTQTQVVPNLTEEKLDKILNEEVRTIILNPLEQYNNLKEGDQQALKHLVKAGHILNKVFMKQEHEKGTKFIEELTKKANEGNKPAQKTLEVYKIFNGIQDERKETNFLIKGEKLADGKNFYPSNATPEEVAQYLKDNINEASDILSSNTVVKKEGNKFVAIPYQTTYKEEFEEIAKELLEAAKTSTHEGFTAYLKLQAKALTSLDPEDGYKADVAWTKLSDSPLELTITRESYDDQFTGKILEDKALQNMLLKNNIEGHSKDMLGIRIGIVDQKAGAELADYKNHLKDFSKFMPLSETYKQSTDGENAQEAVKQTLVDVDLVMLAGDSRTSRPGMTVAQNLPNSDKLSVKRGHGSRNVFHRDIRKSYDPVVREQFLTQLVEQSQRNLYSNEADHLFTIAHELTHSLGPMKTKDGLDKKSSLGSWGDAIEEAKADLGGILMSKYFTEIGKYTPKQLDEIYFTWAADLMPQEEPSKAQAHRLRAVAQFNYLKEYGAINFEENGKLSINKEVFPEAVKNMLTEIITLQLDGNAKTADKFMSKYCVWTKELQYASEILKSMKPKIYRKLDTALADKLLSDKN